MLATEIFAAIGGRPTNQVLRYTSEALQPLFTIPTLWTQILLDLYKIDSAGGPASPVLECVFIALHQVSRDADDATWRMAWESGFVTTLCKLFARGYICGYTQGQLVSPVGQETETLNMVVCSSILLDTCLSRISKSLSPSNPEFKRVLQILETDVVKVYDKLWKIRTPFLTSQVACSPTGTGPIVSSLHSHLVELAVEVATMLRDFQNMAVHDVNSRIPHLMLFVWIHNFDMKLRCSALRNLVSTFNLQSLTTFFPSVSDGCTSYSHIISALVRDLKDERIVNQSLYLVVSCVVLRYIPDNSQDLLDSATELKLVPLTLAATRRQLCSGVADEPILPELLLTTISSMKRLETDPPRSDAQIYDFFGLLCYHFRLHITGGGNLTPQEVVDILGWFLPWLRQLDQHDSRPRMLARRRLMRSRWQATSDELARSQVARQSAEWTAFSRMWRRAGTFFPPVPDAAESPFEPLERCGWGECLCSVHKPAHRMRICRGCWLVAYCGTKCQTSDWEHGEHQRRCRRRGA